MEWIIFVKKRLLPEWFRDRWKERTHSQTFLQQKVVCYMLNPLNGKNRHITNLNDRKEQFSCL